MTAASGTGKTPEAVATGSPPPDRADVLLTAICPACGAWWIGTLDARWLTARYELPCQRCGRIFRLVGETAAPARVRYWRWFRAVHGRIC